MSGITPFLNVLEPSLVPGGHWGPVQGVCFARLLQTHAAQRFLCLRTILAPIVLTLVLHASCRAPGFRSPRIGPGG